MGVEATRTRFTLVKLKVSAILKSRAASRAAVRKEIQLGFENRDGDHDEALTLSKR